MNQKIQDIINESLTVKSLVLNDLRLVGLVGDLVTLITDRFRQGKHLYFCGNGGSAADAQHLAAEFSGRFYINRDALPSEALHCNTSYLTAVANDFGYDLIYSRLIKGIGKPGDILVGLHEWETIRSEDINYIVNQTSLISGTEPLKFYVIRGQEVLYGNLRFNSHQK